MKVAATIQFKRRGRTRRIKHGETKVAPGRIPRIAKLIVLAIRFEELIKNGDVADYAVLARLAHVSRARITQIMKCLYQRPHCVSQVLAYVWSPLAKRMRSLSAVVNASKFLLSGPRRQNHTEYDESELRNLIHSSLRYLKKIASDIIAINEMATAMKADG